MSVYQVEASPGAMDNGSICLQINFVSIRKIDLIHYLDKYK